jgi:hypothetical protein
MEFKKYDGEERSVYLKERSVAIFSGEGTNILIQRDTRGFMGSAAEKLTKWTIRSIIAREDSR